MSKGIIAFIALALLIILSLSVVPEGGTLSNILHPTEAFPVQETQLSYLIEKIFKR